MNRQGAAACDNDIPRVLRGDLHELPHGELTALSVIGHALSDATRLQIVHLLGQRPDLCTCEFEELLGLSQSRVSYHLRVLLTAGLVARKTYGTWSHYSLRVPDTLERLRGLSAAAAAG